MHFNHGYLNSLSDIKLLEENIGRTFFDISCNRIFSDQIPKENKNKTKKIGSNKLKSFHISKETINRTKRHLSEWERIFANEVINKGLIFKIHKQHNINKSNNPMKKWEKDLNRHFFFGHTDG